MLINIETLRGAVVVRPAGEIDLGVSEQLRTSIDAALEQYETGHLIINLKGVSYIDSSGLGVLLGRYKRLAAAGGKVSLVDPRPQVKKILELSGLLRIMGEYRSEDEAVAGAG